MANGVDMAHMEVTDVDGTDGVTYYKALHHGRRATQVEGFTWPEPGVWLDVEGDLVPCVNGLHVCRVDQLLGWLSEELWVVEVDGELLDAGDKCVARRARLVSQVPDLEWRLRMFAAECAEAVLPLFERVYPGDDRPRAAISAARDLAEGRIDPAALAAARSAAWDAVRRPTGVGLATGDDAWFAARSAAQSAAGAAAGNPARIAARVVIRAAGDAIGDRQKTRLAHWLEVPLGDRRKTRLVHWLEVPR